MMIRDPVPFQPATKAPTSGVASCLQWVLLSLPSAQPATTGIRTAGGGGDLPTSTVVATVVAGVGATMALELVHNVPVSIFVFHLSISACL
jgi:hypothetical protein